MYKSTVSDAVCGEDADKCYICLSPFEKQVVASLEKCQHVFCLECILQWSQTANTCPVDRTTFDSIQQRRRPGGTVRKKIKVKTNKREDDYDEEEEEEEGNNTVICEECGRGDRRHRLLVCTRCDSGYHTDCLTPSSDSGPGGDWICAQCAVTPQHAALAFGPPLHIVPAAPPIDDTVRGSRAQPAPILLRGPAAPGMYLDTCCGRQSLQEQQKEELNFATVEAAVLLSR
ncbi:PHD and RING finger domain-containing protein 1 isoform X3 [Gasterosteus aculeatus]